MAHEQDEQELTRGQRLDRLISRYLAAEESRQQVNSDELLKDQPDLRLEFEAFLSGHHRLKRHDAQVTGTVTCSPAPDLPIDEPMGRVCQGVNAGDIVGDCRILKELGRGAMGVVYLAEHTRVHDLRAVKILPREKVSDAAIKRFQKEAETAAKIKNLHVVGIQDVGRDKDVHFIVMQYVEGKTFAELLDDHLVRSQGKPFSWDVALQLAESVLDALAAMHAKGVVHRDIKPSNLMVDTELSRKSHVIVMDFGLVLDQRETKFTDSSGIVGTPAYMSREQARGEPIDGRTDIYAVGATMYYLLTGRVPFEGDCRDVHWKAASGDRPTSLAELRPDVPPKVRRLVEKAMEPDMDKRFRRAVDMLAEVSKILKRIRKVPKSTKRSDASQQDPNSQPRIQTPQTVQETVASVSDTSVDEPVREFVPLELASKSANDASSTCLSLPLTPHTLQGTFWKDWHVVAGAVAVLLVISTAILFTTVPHDPSGEDVTDQRMEVPEESPDAGARSHEDMVYVPTGGVQLGAAVEQLHQHALSLESIKDEPEAVEKFVRFCRKESHQLAHVKGFWIDKYEVTNAEYEQFVKATGRPPPPQWNGVHAPAGKADHPVVNISHSDSTAFAEWVGKKLPTIAQWTRAFRGDDDRMYPWGSEWHSERANTITNTSFEVGTSSIRSSPLDISPFSVFNMVGNAAEIMREQTVSEGQTVTIRKGAHSETNGDLYGAAPMQFYLGGENARHKLTGFRCVIEE